MSIHPERDAMSVSGCGERPWHAVASRQRNLSDLRRLKPPAMALLVHRGGRWDRVESTDLLPGDVVSIARPVGALAVSRDAGGGC
jgi:hypothetical protein